MSASAAKKLTKKLEVLRGPIKAAKIALQKFPGIGEPGAEKTLLFAGIAPLLGLDSNGLRVLVRLQEHGRVLCKCSKLRCSECPLASNCAFQIAA